MFSGRHKDEYIAEDLMVKWAAIILRLFDQLYHHIFYILYRFPSHVAVAHHNIRMSEAQMRRLYPYRRATALTKASTPSYIQYRAFRLA